jgi:hypothetical protein
LDSWTACLGEQSLVCTLVDNIGEEECKLRVRTVR